MRIKMFDELARKKVFTVKEATRISGIDRNVLKVILSRLERRKIIYPYSDSCNAEVLVYSLQEIFAEKIRSLFQRTRPRDLYDVWYLSKLGLDVSSIIDEKFRFKGVDVDFDVLLDRKEDFRNAGGARSDIS